MNKILIGSTNIYRYNLYDEIEDFNTYAEFIEDLAMMSENDAVALYINSPGGRIDVGVSLINAIKYSKAPVTAIVESPSYSMASIIALACKKLIMLDNTFLMFHNYSTMAGGKGQEFIQNVQHTNDHFKKLMLDVCCPFLTRKEVEQTFKDQDIYVYNDDVSLEKRTVRHFKGVV